MLKLLEQVTDHLLFMKNKFKLIGTEESKYAKFI